jgi:hypothetical protein
MVAIAERSKRGQGIDVALKPVEEIGVPDESDLYCFGHARNLLTWRQIVDEGQIVEDGEGRGEGTDEVLGALQIDAVLDADPRVVLR